MSSRAGTFPSPVDARRKSQLIYHLGMRASPIGSEADTFDFTPANEFLASSLSQIGMALLTCKIARSTASIVSVAAAAAEGDSHS